MTPQERQARIREMVTSEGQARVETLAQVFGVSAETIRRDLARLARDGLLRKVHGGARPMRLFAEGSRAERAAEGAEAKGRIARRLAALVEPGETLFMDAGTTTLACAEALGGTDGLTVVTNSLDIAQRLGRSAAVFLLGGRFNPDDSETVGPLVIEQIGRFQADRAVLTVAGLDAEAGATDASFDEAQIARAMIAHAASVTVVAHAAKLGRRAAFRVCPAGEIDLLICDRAPPEPIGASLAGARVELA
ncbi:DeoR/GlpR family DNA-binding transcription regulator [Rubellimicrobium sp. CFH 75288]|uniref:DeoR/GlpR family DNA-binding transcription regulator n=1 Tax=Rubellimicrobium sp. CFH 75288 TaxID=2697034 RepID=UPI001411EE14|nr:DeoR/GlpR family DNA-binding transcription regulator [Rubellimicrobium sp. CFH 75288]NAZ37549.1 DeoR family transcriptional regulator [Rubellimicrobium sp. CFH 75288]